MYLIVYDDDDFFGKIDEMQNEFSFGFTLMNWESDCGCVINPENNLIEIKFHDTISLLINSEAMRNIPSLMCHPFMFVLIFILKFTVHLTYSSYTNNEMLQITWGWHYRFF